MATTGHESEAINVQGLKASMQKLKTEYLDGSAYLEDGDSSSVIADFDPQADTLWKKAQVLSAAERAQVQQNIGVREWLNNLTGEKFVSVTATAQTSDVTTLLPASGAGDTIYRVGMWDGTAYNQEYYSDYAWDGQAYVQLNKKSIVGEVFDISEYNGGASYASLSAALGVDGANVPESVRKGGMSIKYVSNSDNNYVQYRCMAQNFTTDITQWQGVDEEPIAGSMNFVTSHGIYDALQIGDTVEIDLSQYTAVRAFPNPTRWITNNDMYPYYGIFVPIVGGKRYLIKANKNAPCFYGFLKNNTYSAGGVVPYATGCTRNTIAKNVLVLDSAPTDATYLYVATYTDADNTPSRVALYDKKSIDDVLDEQESEIQDVSARAGYKRTVTLNSSWKNNGTAVEYTGYCRTKDMVALPSNITKITWVFGQGVNYSDTNVQILFYNSNKELVNNYNPGTSSAGASGGLRNFTTIDNSWAYVNASFLMGGTSIAPLGIYIDDEPFFNVIEESTGAYKDVEGVENDIQELYSRKMFLKNGVSISAINGSYVTTDSNNKKIVNSNSALCYFQIPVEWFRRSITVFRRLALPSTASPYARLFFFDVNDNLLLMQDFRWYELKEVFIPDNSTQCYFSVNKTWKGCFDFYFDLLSSIRTIEQTGITTTEQKNARTNMGLEDGKDAAVYRNLDVAPKLYSSCNYRKSSNTSKDFQLLIVTDSHGDNPAVQNAKDIANGFVSIDALIHCGDIVNDYYPIGSNHDEQWNDIVDNSSKPCFFVMGNHEKGTYPQIYGTPTDEELYNAFIKKMVDNGWLVSGEYAENKCYWFHDFATLKIRLIALDEYEAPTNLFDETYWKAIAYDSSLSNYTVGTSYQTGDKINVPGYTAYSFEAVQPVTTAYHNNKVPAYKYSRGYRWISQTQAQWFLDTLASTPSGYKVIIGLHNPFSKNATAQTELSFCQNGTHSAAADMQSYMTNDFIADAINAFVTKSDFTTTCNSHYPTDMPSYTVSKDFSNVVGTFHSLIGGHSHKDLIWKHNTYNQYQVCPVDANTTSWAASQNSDIRRPNSTNGNVKGVDCLTVVSFGANRLGLVKVDVNITDDGNKRDYEIVSLSS